MPTRSASSSAVFAIVLAACAPRVEDQAATPMAVDTAAVVSAATAYWPRWINAVTAGDMAAMGALLTDSVRIDTKGAPPMVGKAAWAAAFGPLMQSMKVNSEIITPEQTTAISNELAYQTGDYVEASTTAGKSSTEYGRYAAAIRKDADGQWRLAYVMAFADSTVPAKK
jgi:ketosteroid isomerase-like protein